MSRSYKGIRPESKRVYSVEQVCALYKVCKNTVSNWVKAGLRPSDDRKPHLFQGAELKRFHAERQGPPGKLSPGQIYCFGCKRGVTPLASTWHVSENADGRNQAEGTCPSCGSRLKKFLSATDRDTLSGGSNPNTHSGPTDERKCSERVSIGSEPGVGAPTFPMVNDRVVFAWQVYAQKYHHRTIDAHLTAIREFERFGHGRAFRELTPEDVSRYRNHLTERGRIPAERGGISTSTIRHRASHLRQFLAWLCQQPGCEHLNRMLPGYVDLPKGSLAPDLDGETRRYPSLQVAECMLAGMPSISLLDRRQRAIFAIAFVGALRAGALISLQLGDVDLETG